MEAEVICGDAICIIEDYEPFDIVSKPIEDIDIFELTDFTGLEGNKEDVKEVQTHTPNT